jgi:hypothetical protein
MIRIAVSICVSLVFSMLLVNSGGCSDINYEPAIERTDKTIIVKKGANFQEALDRAQPGDTISLEAGALFKGAFKLPKKTGKEYITIRSSAKDDQLPRPDERLDPTKYAAVLPKIRSDVKGEPAIGTLPGAHHFRFIGIEFEPTIDGLYNIIRIGEGDERKIEDLPHDIEFDRVYIHGSPEYGQRRGIAANGRFITIKNSYISDIKQKGDESQAIGVWATDGPIQIVNNYLEAAAENILFGGAGSYLKLVPTDCLIKNNHLNKPLNWRDDDWVVKNLFEIKNGRRIRVENNLMTNNWVMGQDGFAILVTTRADNGKASIIEDVEFVGNIIRGSACGVNILGSEGSKGHNLRIRNNLFEDITGPKWGGSGHFLKLTDWNTLIIENNTILQTENIAIAYGVPILKFVFRNNIVFQNTYGFFGDNMGTGPKSLDTFFPGGSIANNIIIGGDRTLYKENNFYLTSVRQVGFVNAQGGDYTLRSDSPYLNKGVDGGRIGAEIDVRMVGKN